MQLSKGKNKYYVNVMNEKDKEMMWVHLNKLECEIVKDDTSEENGEEIDDSRMEDRPMCARVIRMKQTWFLCHLGITGSLNF